MADIGTVLGGRYRLLELLGQGGMATIYRARDAQLERDVAVKVLRPEYGRDPDFFARFRQEAQSAASLNHPGVVAVYDYGTDTVGPFIVMELVDGEDLASIIKRSGALPARQAARLTSGVARAIAAAHESGFVHRDIKPGNILVTREGRVKVADFGIARALAETALTLPGTTLGSVHYFSPEQARGEMTTPASDIYSLGIVLFELLTGQRPWHGDSAAAIATARLTGAVPSPSSHRAGVPPILEAITRKAMALEPEARFGAAADMADALDRYLAESASAGGAGAAAGAGAGAAAGGAGAGAVTGGA
ncbi:MAG: protein kinase, partial [Chloroflexi bacterium]|nr:protein kinase [Chloroflexota bacterium]